MQSILPVDTREHGLGRFAVGQIFNEGKDQHQRQQVWRKGRRTICSVQGAKIHLVKQRADVVTDGQVNVAFAPKGGLGNPHRICRYGRKGLSLQRHLLPPSKPLNTEIIHDSCLERSRDRPAVSALQPAVFANSIVNGQATRQRPLKGAYDASTGVFSPLQRALLRSPASLTPGGDAAAPCSP